uniref:Molybdopterin biosynthesis protein n=1 Tax=Caloglossa intermedia TaxID=100879 RepID=A0A1Z1M607_9FLOR|nr:Molybdopterin biosynthesis protein [Caloglossa intermedia]ARW61538.1 Molybdopterin biosynthesis protein [Caloglossa intermedia]
MLDPKTKTIDFYNQEYILYAKHFIIDNIQLEGQKRLKKAKILIIGAGGIGCPAMLYSAACGVGYIGIADSDLVSISNLNRQILYSYSDLNKSKVECAKKRLKSINSYCKIIIHRYKIDTKNASEIIQYYDIIIDATDNFNARYIIDIYCNKLHKIHLYAAVDKFEGHISILNYKNNIRYRDIYPKERNLISNTCNSEGILGVTTGHIGVIQAAEVAKIILGIKKNIHNNLSIYNLLNTSMKHKKFYFTSTHNYKYVKERSCYKFVSRKQTEKYFQNKIFRKNTIILDIRYQYEFSEYFFKYAINIPIDKFKINKTVFFLKKYIKKTVFIYCNTQYRSTIISNICQNNNIPNYIIEN